MPNQTHKPSRYPLLLLGREGARVGKGLAQEHSANSKFSQAGDRTRDLSIASRTLYH